jgi:mannose-6-phosphate isomerase-like protein (cupin superfamily)
MWLSLDDSVLGYARAYARRLGMAEVQVLSTNTEYTRGAMITSSSSNQDPTMHAINLAAKLSTFSDHWHPRVVGQFNGHDLMVVKVKGEFVWHKHDDTDDFFLVLSGHISVQLRDGTVNLGPGEVFVVPKGVEHRPVAEEEAQILLIEPQGTPNTGNVATAAARQVI